RVDEHRAGREAVEAVVVLVEAVDVGHVDAVADVDGLAGARLLAAVAAAAAVGGRPGVVDAATGRRVAVGRHAARALVHAGREARAAVVTAAAGRRGREGGERIAGRVAIGTGHGGRDERKGQTNE